MASFSFVLHSSLFYIESGKIGHINGKKLLKLIYCGCRDQINQMLIFSFRLNPVLFKDIDIRENVQNVSLDIFSVINYVVT